VTVFLSLIVLLLNRLLTGYKAGDFSLIPSLTIPLRK